MSGSSVGPELTEPGGPAARPDQDRGRIVVRNLHKRFGLIQAVRDLSFTVEPGMVTGFLGPNGSGKTTTLRIVLGLVNATEGEATVNGVRYEQLPRPATEVGAVLDSQGFHPGRRARAHLRVYACAIGVPDRRADELLALVGLTDAANRKVGGFSLGMRQRLALATALLGDPGILVLDEPGSGLDPEGLAWLRGFLRTFAASGRTVLVSSHQLAEMEQTADRVVIISNGAQVFQGSLAQLGGPGQDRLRVHCADQAKLAYALAERGVMDIQALPDGWLSVTGANGTLVGEVALAAGVAIYGINEQRADLEQRFFQLTSGQYQPAAVPGGPGSFAPGPPDSLPPGPAGPPVTSAPAPPTPGSAPPVPGEPATTADPAQPNPAQPNPAQPNPAQPNPAQPNPAQPNPAQPNPAQPNPAQPNPAQPNPAQPNPAQPNPAQPNPAQPNPAQPNPAQPNPAQPNPAQPNPAQPSPASSDPARSEPADAAPPDSTPPTAPDPDTSAAGPLGTGRAAGPEGGHR